MPREGGLVRVFLEFVYVSVAILSVLVTISGRSPAKADRIGHRKTSIHASVLYMCPGEKIRQQCIKPMTKILGIPNIAVLLNAKNWSYMVARTKYLLCHPLFHPYPCIHSQGWYLSRAQAPPPGLTQKGKHKFSIRLYIYL